MKILTLLLSTILLFIYASCQPAKTVKTDETTMVDSSFYYVQEDISDPFLDTVFQAPDKPIDLKKEIYPPPPQKPRFKEIEGFRVQIFAGIDSINAISTRAQTVEMTTDSVYLFSEKGLLKIQVGDYPYRYQADTVKEKFRRNGFPGAWVILRPIFIPIDSAAVDSLSSAQDVPATIVGSAESATSGKFKIQIIATGSEERAGEIVTNIKQTMNFTAFYKKEGNLYKVFVGYFNDENAARNALVKIRENGFPDAWLVY